MEVKWLLMIHLINVYSVAGIMKNTLPILSYLIFNNILLVFFHQRSLKNKIIRKKAYDFTRGTSRDIKQKSRKKKGNESFG